MDDSVNELVCNIDTHLLTMRNRAGAVAERLQDFKTAFDLEDWGDVRDIVNDLEDKLGDITIAADKAECDQIEINEIEDATGD